MQQDFRIRVFLVGDAGGFVDALTGEGIYGALHSGQAAAHAILAETRGEGRAAEVFADYLQGYRQTLRFSSRAAMAFYANPARGFRAMRLPFVRKSLVRTYTHGLNVKSLCDAGCLFPLLMRAKPTAALSLRFAPLCGPGITQIPATRCTGKGPRVRVLSKRKDAATLPERPSQVQLME